MYIFQVKKFKCTALPEARTKHSSRRAERGVFVRTASSLREKKEPSHPGMYGSTGETLVWRPPGCAISMLKGHKLAVRVECGTHQGHAASVRLMKPDS